MRNSTADTPESKKDATFSGTALPVYRETSTAVPHALASVLRDATVILPIQVLPCTVIPSEEILDNVTICSEAAED